MWQKILAGNAWQGTFLNRRKKWSAVLGSSNHFSAVRDLRGEITHFVAVKEDITERRSTEEQLRMNAAVFETTNEGIMITTPDARIISVNPAFTNITGYTAAEVIGQTPQLLNSGKQKKSFYQDMWQTLIEEGGWSGEVWNKTPQTVRFYPQWLSIAAVRNSDGQLETVCCRLF